MPGINTKQVELGRNNLDRVRSFFQTHLCATNRECSKVLGLSVEAVGRHVKTIRGEWGQDAEGRIDHRKLGGKGHLRSKSDQG